MSLRMPYIGVHESINTTMYPVITGAGIFLCLTQSAKLSGLSLAACAGCHTPPGPR